MKRFQVYLSSTKYHWWNFRSFNWKKKLIDITLKKNKKIKFHDPLEFDSEEPIVCDLDIKEINKSQFVVVYIDKITIGTMLELAYCIYKNSNKNWCILTYNKKVMNHPWIVRLCENKVYTDINKVSNLINRIYSEYIYFSNKKRR